jgi:hypothetical protein
MMAQYLGLVNSPNQSASWRLSGESVTPSGASAYTAVSDGTVVLPEVSHTLLVVTKPKVFLLRGATPPLCPA